MCDMALAEDETSVTISDWCSLNNIRELIKIACPGDRLEFSRKGYEHWSIYIGTYKSADHQIVHFGIERGVSKFSATKICSMPRLSSDQPEILLSSIEETLKRDKVRINNTRDSTMEADWEPLSQTDIVRRAIEAYEKQEDETFAPYHLIKNNCEHFVNWCRYDRKHSDQTRRCYRRIETWILIFVVLAFAVTYEVGLWRIMLDFINNISWRKLTGLFSFSIQHH